MAIMGNGHDLTVLPIVEISFDALPAGMNPIYSYEAKWMWDTIGEAAGDLRVSGAMLRENCRRD